MVNVAKGNGAATGRTNKRIRLPLRVVSLLLLLLRFLLFASPTPPFFCLRSAFGGPADGVVTPHERPPPPTTPTAVNGRRVIEPAHVARSPLPAANRFRCPSRRRRRQKNAGTTARLPKIGLQQTAYTKKILKKVWKIGRKKVSLSGTENRGSDEEPRQDSTDLEPPDQHHWLITNWSLVSQINPVRKKKRPLEVRGVRLIKIWPPISFKTLWLVG